MATTVALACDDDTVLIDGTAGGICSLVDQASGSLNWKLLGGQPLIRGVTYAHLRSGNGNSQVCGAMRPV